MTEQLNNVIIHQIKLRLSADESIGIVLSEILGISTDAVYRRLRNEKEFSLSEVLHLCKHFQISMDALFSIKANTVTFEYKSIEFDEFSLLAYLQNVNALLRELKTSSNPKLLLTINNTPFFQLFNFKRLLRVKLFFWAKSQLKAEKYRQFKLDDFQLTAEQQRLCDEILNNYNDIASTELFDIELLRGFAREISYHAASGAWISENDTHLIYDDLFNLVDHLKAQTEAGIKFKFGTALPAKEHNFEVYYNETLNASSTFYYTTTTGEGLFITHNFLNPLLTTQQAYVKETKAVLNNLLDVSTKISEANQKTRSIFFANIRKNIEAEK